MNKYFRLVRMHVLVGKLFPFLSGVLGILLAKQQGFEVSLWIYPAFFCGAFLVSCAGCVVNDIFDSGLDSRVERTKNRVIAAGEVSKTQAWVIFAGLGAACLALLFLFNKTTILTGICAGFLIVLYPLCKRFTYYPQFVLGLVFNAGFLMGFTAVSGYFQPKILPFYLALVFWTVIYDTLYAKQDEADDLTAGIKSTAVRFGTRYKAVLSGFSVIFLAMLLTFGVITGQNPRYFLCIYIAWALLALLIFASREGLYGKIFKANIWVGLPLLFAVI